MKNSKEYILHLASQNQPTMAFDKNVSLNEWQNSAREKLKELLGLPLIQCDDVFTIQKEEKKEGYSKFDFTFQSEPGYEVGCSLLVPDGIKEPKPVVICLQGHSSGKHISAGEPYFPGDPGDIAGGRDFAVQAVREGYCAIALEQRYMGFSGSTEKGKPSCLADNTAMAALLMGRTAIGERVWDVQRLMDVIEKHLTQYIDPGQIICLGNSGGGTTTFYAACVDERIRMAVPSCAVCTFEESIMAMYHCPCNFVPNIRKYFNMGDLGCLIAPRPLIVVCGIEDKIFPVHGVEKSYNIMREAYESIGKESLCHLVKGNGGHMFYPEEVWPIIRGIIG